MARISRQGFQSSGAAPEDLRISMDLQKWRICVYVRLSREDERNISRKGGPESQPQSESIMNQKSILRSWIEDYFEPGSYEIAGYFEDDGLTGTDDEREGFMRMVGTIERGEANCFPRFPQLFRSRLLLGRIFSFQKRALYFYNGFFCRYLYGF